MSNIVYRCPQCGSSFVNPTSNGQYQCKICQTLFAVGAVPPQEPPVPPYTRQGYAAGNMGMGGAMNAPYANSQSNAVYQKVNNRNKVIAALLAFFLGGLGLHKFYLGRWLQGIFYLLFSWTFIPSVISFFEAIRYLCMSDASFDRHYNMN